MMSIALVQGGIVPSPIYFILFMALFLAGVSMSYSFLLLLSSTAIWMVRNQSLMELWWLFTTLMRYPRDIYDVSWAIPIKLIFSFILPALLVISVPSEVAARQLVNPLWITWTIIASVLSLKVSRMVFQWSIRSYRSASS
jgi:ABC-2 type transport system permease protein